MKTTRTLTLISAAATTLAALADYTHLIPGEKGALAASICGGITIILIAIGDYLDDGQINGSFLPGRKSPAQLKPDTTHE